MAFIRNCFVITITMFAVLFTNAQTISYPVQSSKTLKSTAEDVALLLQKAINGSHFTTGTYTALPQSGFIFIYDSSITNGQACKVESDGAGFIKFSAAEDNGMCFGIYQYLQQLVFVFICRVLSGKQHLYLQHRIKKSTAFTISVLNTMAGI